MLSAVVSAHLAHTFRHFAAGTQETVVEEVTVTIVGESDEIGRVRQVRAEGFVVPINPRRRLAYHEDHCDPAIPFVRNGRTMLQIFLHEASPRKLSGHDVQVEIDGAIVVLPTETRASIPDNVIGSRLFRRNGAIAIEVNGSDQTRIETIWQTSRYGRESEIVGDLVSGSSVLSVPAAFADRYGICLSTDDAFGGIEHKHMIYGEAGHSSGRHLAIGDRIIGPKLREDFAYRSLILVDDEAAPERAAKIVSEGNFDEVDIWCSPKRATTLGRLSRDRVKITRYAAAGSLAAKDADVLMVRPGAAVPKGKPISFTLFRDQRDADFASTIAEAVTEICNLDADLDVVERAWLGDVRDQIHEGREHYGIGFSTSGDLPHRRAVELAKRLRMPERSSCAGCDAISTCNGVIAAPWAETMAPSGTSCRLKTVLS